MAVLTTIGITLGYFALFEGAAAIMKEIVGDPEQDVTAALQRLQAKTARRHVTDLAAEQATSEDIDEQFAQFNQIPQRALSEAAILQNSPNPNPQDTGLLDYVSQRLRVPPREFERISSPSRLGDMSSLHRTMGKSLPSAPPSRGVPASSGNPQAPQGGAPPA